MIDEHENLLDGASIGKEPSEIWTAESYLRGFARHPADRGTREKRLKYLAMLLLIEAGKESIYSIILPYGESDHGKDGTEKTD